MEEQQSIEDIAQAIYTINRHAKTAPKPQHLYYLKNETIKKLLSEKRAKKVGLQFSNRPKLSHQHSMLLIQIGSYYFHTIPNKDDFKNLPHLGHIDHSHHNPPVDRKSTRLNSSHVSISYGVFCLKQKYIEIIMRC